MKTKKTLRLTEHPGITRYMGVINGWNIDKHCYESPANDISDTDADYPRYTVLWDILEGMENCEDGADACDWAKPSDIIDKDTGKDISENYDITIVDKTAE